MMSLTFAFWMFVVLFAIVGAMRGWAKELLVTFSVILSLALNLLLRKYVPVIQYLQDGEVGLFYIRSIILIVLVFFGYQTVYHPALMGKASREKLQDTLLGVVLGGFNGYLIVGTLWYYLHIAGYPFNEWIIPADPFSAAGLVIADMMQNMPPLLLGEPGIYFAIILAFVFVLVVFI